MARVVLSGYLVRNPLGGYAWQAAHYLLGLRALGHDAWFYEDTSLYPYAYNPETNEFGPAYEYGAAATAAFLGRLGFGERWTFRDVDRGTSHGPLRDWRAVLRDADLVVSIAGINRVGREIRGARPAAYVDVDPAFTQIRAEGGDAVLCELLAEHDVLFTYGENIGTPRSPVPVAGRTWHPTRPPVVVEQWAAPSPADGAYTTVGRWNETQRDLRWRGETFQWRKRTEWLRVLDLPARTGATFEVAMDVDSVPGDRTILEGHGWRIADPRAVSADPWRYRDYVRASRGEFTVAKELNVRLRSGWFSDRAVCYLAAGRPVVEQDTGFGDVLPLGPGMHAFRTAAEAAEAVREIEADHPRAARHAREVAHECFAAARVVGALLRTVGL
jgi:hypothetical protein